MDLERGEISRIRRLKDGKAMGMDGVPGEVWWRRNREMGVVMQQSMEGGGVERGVERGYSRAN